MNMSLYINVGPIFFRLALKKTPKAVMFPKRPMLSTNGGIA